MTSPYNPTCNGISERLNATIKNKLRIYKGESLNEIVKKIEVNLNFSFHSTLKASPIEILKGYSVFDLLKKNIKDKLPIIKANEKIIKENEIKNGNKKRRDLNLIKTILHFEKI
ncbi:hypothetical protein DMUE_5726 [Dictyocoela muelleri]|nr:hypothetical protein DMUE_5726 [Dictyocoela muelleri]